MTLFLIGYSTGGGTAPLFMEPIFSNGSDNFIQACELDKITDFVAYEDEVDILEQGFEVEYGIGSYKVFAVLDAGGRVISGDRSYVTRYLKQNKDGYIDTPYFYASALEFCDIRAPELLFLNHRSELLEASALSNSLRRYCQYERERLINSEKSVPSDSIVYWLTQQKSDSIESWRCAHSLSGENKSFVRLWLDFASTDAPRLTERSKWKDIDSVYKTLALDNDKRNHRYLWWIVSAAQDYLSEVDMSKAAAGNLVSKNTSHSRELSFHSNIWTPTSRRSRFSNLLHKFFKDNLAESVKSEKVSTIEISMAVFFFKLSFKIYGEEILENEEARNKISRLSLNSLQKMESGKGDDE